MRTLPCIFAGLLAMGPVPVASADDLPAMIRVYLEYIEVPHETLTDLMAGKHGRGSGTLHREVRALVKRKKAHILESCIAVARPGQKMSIESMMEHITPTEYEPSSFPSSLPTLPLGAEFKIPLRPDPTNAFEVRNVGVTLEIEPNIGADEEIIELRLAPEITWFLRNENWHEHVDQWGEAHILQPVHESKRLSTAVTLRKGKFALIGVLTPTLKTGGFDPRQRLMVFVRADVVKVVPPREK